MRFFRRLFRRRRLEQELEMELALHRELAAAHGNPIPLGNTTRVKEDAADFWRFTILENLWRDLGYGARVLRRNPTLVITAVISLALGIGANTVIFSLAMEFLLSKPSVSSPGSLVYARVGGNSHSLQPVLDYVRQSGIFTDVAGVQEESFVNWNDGVETRFVHAAFASKNFFTALGVPVAYGRGILPDDPDQVVVLHDRFWRKYFHADPSVVGRTIQIEGQAYTVVGILPPQHRSLEGFGTSTDVYVPRYREDTMLAMYCRLKPNQSRTEALAALQTVAQRLDAENPAPYRYAEYVTVSPIAGIDRLLHDRDATTLGAFFAILLTVVALVLLIACVNVAGLLLSRASARRREIATRLALGASRGRLLQQLLMESLLLSLLGAGCGLALAYAIARLLTRIELPIPIPIYLNLELDWRVALYAAVLTVVSTVTCGLLPARQAVKESIAPDLLREKKLRLRRTLVTAQIALSLVVLTAGMLFVRNVMLSSAMSPGFDLRHTIRATVDLSPVTYKDPERIRLYVDRALSGLHSIPGIDAAAGARVIPFMDASRNATELTFPDNGQKERVRYYYNSVTPEYFRAMEIPLRQGRSFSSTDSGDTLPVIVNRAFAASYLNGRSALGATFILPDGASRFRVIGVVEGTKNYTLGEGDLPQLYQPFFKNEARLGNRIQFVLRSSLAPETQLDAVRRTLRDVEPSAGLEVARLSSSIGLAFFPSQVGAVLMGTAGVLGLLLATVGLYGTMVYSIARRTQEIGVRIAIGATSGDITRMILLDSARLVGTGCAIGLLITYFVTKPLAIFLVPGLNPADPFSFLAVVAVLSLTGLLASWGPLRRALAIDPVASLRYE